MCENFEYRLLLHVCLFDRRVLQGVNFQVLESSLGIV